MKRGLVVCLVVAGLMAGCAETPAPAPAAANTPYDLVVPGDGPYPSSMAQVANLTLGDGGLTLHLGVGWGQLRILTQGGVDVEIDHESFEEFDPFTDMGNDVYGPGAFTAIRLEGNGKGSGDAEEFWWVGHDAGFSGPRGSSEGAAGGMLDAHGGDGVVLLTVATTVPGYTLHVSDGGPELDWPLGPHPAWVMAVPEPTEAGGADTGPVRAAYRRDWIVPLLDLPPSAIYAYAWTSDFGHPVAGGTRAGLSSGGFGITEKDGQVDGYGPGPDAGYGASFGGGMWDTRVADDGESFQVHLWYEQTDAGTTEAKDGLAVMAMPLTPAAN